MAQAAVKFATTSTFEEIRNVLVAGERAIIAVSYWGAGAIDRLQLKKLDASKVTIVCDLASGACNPAEVKDLQKAGFDVKAVERFHAKVYWTPRAAVVGSANASSNGLGGEGSEQEPNLEANVILSDPAALNAIKKWLDNEVLTRAETVTDPMLAEAKKRWRARQRARPIYAAALSKMLNEPTAFSGRDWCVYVYSDVSFSDEGQAIDDAQPKKFGGWEFDASTKPSPGRWVLDYTYVRRRLSFQGVWEHLDVDPKKSSQGNRYHFALEHQSLPAVKVDKAGLHLVEEFLREKIGRRTSIDEAYTLHEVAQWVSGR